MRRYCEARAGGREKLDLDLDDVYVGRDAGIAGSRHPWGTWDDYHLEAAELIDAGSSVAVGVDERSRGRGSGAPFEVRRQD